MIIYKCHCALSLTHHFYIRNKKLNKNKRSLQEMAILPPSSLSILFNKLKYCRLISQPIAKNSERISNPKKKFLGMTKNLKTLARQRTQSINSPAWRSLHCPHSSLCKILTLIILNILIMSKIISINILILFQINRVDLCQ